jgi:hypothetical protein
LQCQEFHVGNGIEDTQVSGIQTKVSNALTGAGMGGEDYRQIAVDLDE